MLRDGTSCAVYRVESAGGRAVAVPYNATYAEVDDIMSNVNGLLLPGGVVSLSDGARYAIQKVKALNDAGTFFPLWGTCLGFEWIIMAFAGSDGAILDGFDSENISYPVGFTPAAKTSRLFFGMPEYLRKLMGTEPLTFNSHTLGITPDSFATYAELVRNFEMLATNTDRQGKPFVSAVEGKKYPIYAVQWHPEKANFEYGADPDGTAHQVINHSPQAVAVSWYLATAFINAARKNSNSYPTAAAEAAALLYGVPTSLLWEPTFSEVYIFHSLGQQQQQRQQQQAALPDQAVVAAGVAREPQFSDLHGGRLLTA